jgi:hypothetical protein
MSPSTEQPSTLERALALVVRYWACNMTLVHDQGTNWPGFGYTENEKQTLRAIAGKVGSPEFYLWIALVVVLFLTFAALIAIGGVSWLSPADVNPAIQADSSAAAFYVLLCSVIVLGLSVVFPYSMLTASWVCGLWFSTPDSALTDRATTVHFIRKLVFQITRVAVLAGIADLALLLFVPDHSKVSLLLKWVPAVLSPAVSALTLAYYASARLRRSTPGPQKQ